MKLFRIHFVALQIALSLLILFSLAYMIPWHMDEFIMFHPLACLDPQQKFNIYRESCYEYETQFLGFSYHRAYSIVGISSSIIGFPFFSLVNSIWTNYFIGFLFVILISIGIAKSFVINKGQSFFMFAIYFPLSYSVIHDGGPIRISMLVIAWSPILLKNFLDSFGVRRLFWLLALCLTWVVAVEDKPFFVFLIPGIVLLMGSSLLFRENKLYFLTNLKSAVMGIISSCVSVMLFLLITKVEGETYFEYLTAVSKRIDFDVLLKSVLTFDYSNLTSQFDLVNKLLFLFVWPLFGHRVIEFTNFGFGSVLFQHPETSKTLGNLPTVFYLLTVALTFVSFYLLFKNLRPSKQNIKETFTLLFSSISFWFGAFISGGWASHHFVFLHLPILVSILILNKSKNNRLIYFLFSITSVITIISILISPVNKLASREIGIVYEKAIENSDEFSILSCSSWGCYYPYSLTNKNDIPVVFVTPEVPNHFRELEIRARSESKNILVMCTDCTIETVGQYFPSFGVSQIETGTKIWSLFKFT